MAGSFESMASSAYLNRPLRSFEEAAHDVDVHRREHMVGPEIIKKAEDRLRAALARAGSDRLDPPSTEAEEVTHAQG